MLSVIAVVIGALIGGVLGSEAGAVAGALLGWLVVRSLQQQRQITALRARLDEPARPRATAAAAVQARPSPATTVASPSPSQSASPSIASSPAPAASISPTAKSLTTTARTVNVTAAPPAPDVFAPLHRWFLGGNAIVKAGVGILFIGLAFLAKYASEHAHLPVELRLAAIGTAAVALLGVGWRLRRGRPGYAQILQGAAVAVLYLTIFAAFRQFGLLAVAPAFVLMVAVAALAAALAVLQDARALAVVGALGGFATPLIVSTGTENAAGLFAYYLVLDAGIAAVAWFRTWRALNLVGFFATFVVATAWGVLRYTPQSLAMSEGFLVAFFVLFVVVMVLPARRADRAPAALPVDAWVNSSLLFGLPTITFALQYGLVRDTPFGAALSALALAAFYVLLASWMRKRPALGITFTATLAIATVFLTLVIPFALDERSTAGAWTLEGACLVWVGFRQRRGLPRAFGYALLCIAGLAMLLGHERHGDPQSIWNAYLFNGLMAAAASIAAASFVRAFHREGAARIGEEAMEPVLLVLATLWLVSAAAIEIAAFVPVPDTLAAAIVAASGVATVYALLAARLRWPGIACGAALLPPLLLLVAAVDAAWVFDPTEGGGWFAWPLAFVAHAIVLHCAAPRLPAPLGRAAHATGAVAFAFFGALLGRALTAAWGDEDSAWPWLGWLVVPAALLLALSTPALARRWPVRAAPDAYRLWASAVLAVGLVGWTLVANVASDGTASPLPHVPLLNPLDLGVGLALAAVARWLRRTGGFSRASLGVLAAVVFVWLNAMLVRAFHHYGGVPYRLDAWAGSLAVQTGITLLWTALALLAMWWAASRAARLPWLAGAGLLGAVVLKLLLVDLSGSGSVTRIVSFIGVGVVMLVIGYVAPLPTRETRHAAA